MLHLKFLLSEDDVPLLLYIRWNIHSSLKMLGNNEVYWMITTDEFHGKSC